MNRLPPGAHQGRVARRRSGPSAKTMIRTLSRLAPFAAVLASFALGVAGLGGKALWGDEAYSWWASQQSALALLGGLDAQPPLYHLLLAFGRALFGESAFGLRFASVLCGVAAVALAARAGRAAAGRAGAGASAMLVAWAPLSVYYQQEARMYAVAALFSAGAAAVSLELLARPRASRGLWAAYAALALGALFSHFYTVGVLAVSALALLAGAFRRGAVPAWLAAHLSIAGVFGGWFFGLQWRYLGRAAGARSRIFTPPEELAGNIERGVNGLALGLRAEAALWPIALGLLVLAALGSVGLLRSRRGRSVAWVALGWLAATLGLVFATASPGAVVSDFHPRYLIFAVVPLAVLASGWALGRPGRTARIAMAGLAVAAAVYGNATQYGSDWQKSRYDALMRTLRSRAQPGDVAILANSDQYPHYLYYGPTGVETWLISNEVLNKRDEALAGYDALVSRAAPRRAWLVNYGFAGVMQPRHPVEQRLNQQGARVYAQGFQDATLALYDLLDASGGAPVVAADARFSDGLRLSGVRWRAASLAPGDAAAFDLIWSVDAAPSRDYTVFVHVRRVDTGEQVAVFDGPPLNGERPTSTWRPGEVLTDTRGIVIPPTAAPGEYIAIVGLYAQPEGARLRIGGGEDTEFVARRFEVGR